MAQDRRLNIVGILRGASRGIATERDEQHSEGAISLLDQYECSLLPFPRGGVSPGGPPGGRFPGILPRGPPDPNLLSPAMDRAHATLHTSRVGTDKICGRLGREPSRTPQAVPPDQPAQPDEINEGSTKPPVYF